MTDPWELPEGWEWTNFQEVAQIATWCDRLEDAATADGDDYIDADMAFHTAILDACHNDLLAQLSDTITMALRLSRRLTVSIPGSSLAAMPAHRILVDAISNRDPAAAEAAMHQLLRHTAADIERALHTADRETG